MQLKKQKIYLILSFCGNFSGLRQEEASDVVFIHLVGVVGSNPAARDIIQPLYRAILYFQEVVVEKTLNH